MLQPLINELVAIQKLLQINNQLLEKLLIKK